MSSYAPAWVKRDEVRFPRAARSDGTGLEILSALSPDNLASDANAFAALMAHLKRIDSARHTVLMVQVENEVGMIPEARDHSALANAAFAAPVPAALTDYLERHRATLAPDLKSAWESHGARTGVSWTETFGDGTATDELFTAWTEARYTDQVAAKGKALYPLPLFVNAALIRPGKAPGQYPSGGPLPHLFDIWHAAAPHIDLLAPDLYFPNAIEWARRYAVPDNPLFVPESGRVGPHDLSLNGLAELARLDAFGTSVYAPEHMSADDASALADGFDMIAQLSPLILADQGTGRMIAVRPPVAFDGTEDLAVQHVALGGYTFDMHFRAPAPISIGAASETDIPGAHGGVIVQLGPDEFLVAGMGMIVTFATPGAIAGIERVTEGRFVAGRWIQGRVLNGDDTNQGRELRLPPGIFSLRRVRLYRYH